MYKLLENGLVLREYDNAYIPPDVNNTDYTDYLEWVNAGNKPSNTDDQPDEMIVKLERVLDLHLDSVAQEKRYANRITCALRAGYPGPFQKEGIAFATWMDRCNAFAYEYLADIKSGKKNIPATPEDLINLLPKIQWPT